jgi:hypothetical protein
MKTTINIKNEHTECTITVDKIHMTTEDMLEDLIVPALLALGFSKENIDHYLVD